MQQHARWTASILIVLLAVTVVLTVARRDTASAAKEEAAGNGPVLVAGANSTPTTSAKLADARLPAASTPAAVPDAGAKPGEARPAERASSQPATVDASAEAPRPAEVSGILATTPEAGFKAARPAQVTNLRAAAPAASTKPADASPAEAASASTAPPDPNSLETIGALAAGHYFQAYLNIGFVADGRSKGIYGEEDSRKLLVSVLSVVDSVDRQLESLGKRSMAKEDRKSLEQMRAISTMLRQEGRELQSYWDSGRDQDAARYENRRKDSYAAISQLMGIGR
jgi:hypothetical protein